jgi:hypothetical protein
MNLFDILSHDKRIIVLSNEGEARIITWNRSLTLQSWVHKHYDKWGQSDPRWEEESVRTLSNEPKDFIEAQKAARQWQGDMWKEQEAVQKTTQEREKDWKDFLARLDKA